MGRLKIYDSNLGKWVYVTYGIKGDTGEQGSSGYTGDTGVKGDKGDSGESGVSVHSELSNLEYENSGHIGFQPAGEYLTNISVVLSGGSVNEVGSVVENVLLNWKCNKSMVERTLSEPVPYLDRERGFGGSGEYEHVGAGINSNTTYTIRVFDGMNYADSSTSVVFLHKLYYGSYDSASISNSDLINLNGVLSSSKKLNASIDAGGKYLYIAYPAVWGGADIYVNGMVNTEWDFENRNVTNAYGVSTPYSVYRSNIQYGYNIKIQVE